MNQNATQLLFLRLSLANAYDQQDWSTVQEMCVRIDQLAIAKAQRSIDPDEDVV